jgi:hypothetical protein
MEKRVLMRTSCIALILSFLPVTWIKGQDLPQIGDKNCQPCYLGDRPACELTWAPHVDAVFLGTVVDVSQKSNSGDKTRRLIANVRVDESFRGVRNRQVTISSGGDTCGGYPFSKGNRYLFYSKHVEGTTYSVDLCGGTKWASKASKDLKYLRTIPYLPDTGTIAGTAFIYIKPQPEYSMAARPMKPASTMMIKISDESLATKELHVGQDGQFKVEGLTPGTYRVLVETADPVIVTTASGFSTSDKGQSLTVRAKGCSEVDFKIDPFRKR